MLILFLFSFYFSFDEMFFTLSLDILPFFDVWRISQGKTIVSRISVFEDEIGSFSFLGKDIKSFYSGKSIFFPEGISGLELNFEGREFLQTNFIPKKDFYKISFSPYRISSLHFLANSENFGVSYYQSDSWANPEIDNILGFLKPDSFNAFGYIDFDFKPFSLKSIGFYSKGNEVFPFGFFQKEIASGQIFPKIEVSEENITWFSEFLFRGMVEKYKPYEKGFQSINFSTINFGISPGIKFENKNWGFNLEGSIRYFQHYSNINFIVNEISIFFSPFLKGKNFLGKFGIFSEYVPEQIKFSQILDRSKIFFMLDKEKFGAFAGTGFIKTYPIHYIEFQPVKIGNKDLADKSQRYNLFYIFYRDENFFISPFILNLKRFDFFIREENEKTLYEKGFDLWALGVDFYSRVKYKIMYGIISSSLKGVFPIEEIKEVRGSKFSLEKYSIELSPILKIVLGLGFQERYFSSFIFFNYKSSRKTVFVEPERGIMGTEKVDKVEGYNIGDVYYIAMRLGFSGKIGFFITTFINIYNDNVYSLRNIKTKYKGEYAQKIVPEERYAEKYFGSFPPPKFEIYISTEF